MCNGSWLHNIYYVADFLIDIVNRACQQTFLSPIELSDMSDTIYIYSSAHYYNYIIVMPRDKFENTILPFLNKVENIHITIGFQYLWSDTNKYIMYSIFITFSSPFLLW